MKFEKACTHVKRVKETHMYELDLEKRCRKETYRYEL